MKVLNDARVRKYSPVASLRGASLPFKEEAVLSQGCSEQQLIDDLREHAPISDKTGNARPSGA